MCKLAFFLLAFVAAVLAAPSDDGLESVELIYGDDSLESLELEGSNEERGLFSNSKGQPRCKCVTGTSCQCCARPRIPLVGKFEGCINVDLDNEKKELDIKIVADGKTVVDRKVSTAATERVCDRLPGALDDFKVCMYAATSDLEDKTGFQACPKIDLMKGSKIIGKVTFACVQFKDEKLSLNDNGEVKANDLFKIKTGDPIKGFLNAIGWRQPSNKE